MFGKFWKKSPPNPPERFPPVPDWRPAIVQSIDRIADRVRYYTNDAKDFAILANGTCVLLLDGLSDMQAEPFAKEVLDRILHAHPDMSPAEMDDGNILVRYNHPAINVVLSDVVKANWSEIDRRHQGALVTNEVLITELGHNKFDDFGKNALFGRCFMFMDAQSPRVVRLERCVA